MTQNFYTPDKACAVFLHRLVGVCFSLTTFYEFGRLAYLITSLPAIPSIPPPPNLLKIYKDRQSNSVCLIPFDSFHTMTTAYITLLTNESYLPGVLTLGKVLKAQHDTTHKLAVLINSAALSEDAIALIETIYDDVIDIKDELIYSPVATVRALLGRPELAVTYSKIHLWGLTQYSKLVYLDADTLPLQSLDGLFDLEVALHEVHASPDAGWPDIFNSGVLVLQPNQDIFASLVKFINTEETPSFDGADQGLFNEFFNLSSSSKGNWKRLPFLYNVTPNATYQYTPAFDRFVKDIKLVHFIGESKPWNNGNTLSSGLAQAVADIHRLWWLAFNTYFPAEVGRKILNKKGEAHALKFDKTASQWDKPDLEDTKLNHYHGGITDDPVSAVFPWEQRETRTATRSFSPLPANNHEPTETASAPSLTERVSHDIKKSIETLTNLTVGSTSPTKLASLKETYNIDDSENNQWDPAASLNKIAQLPSKLLSKSRQDDDNKDDKKE